MPATTELVFDWDEEDRVMTICGLHIGMSSSIAWCVCWSSDQCATAEENPLRFRSEVTLQDVESTPVTTSVLWFSRFTDVIFSDVFLSTHGLLCVSFQGSEAVGPVQKEALHE